VYTGSSWCVSVHKNIDIGYGYIDIKLSIVLSQNLNFRLKVLLLKNWIRRLEHLVASKIMAN
jgi:hypothetical protein